MSTDTPTEPTLAEDDAAWLLREFETTAERAQERGITPAAFLMGLSAYGNRLMDDYVAEHPQADD